MSLYASVYLFEYLRSCTFLHASFEQVINVYERIRTRATYVPACMCISTSIYVQFEAGHETFTKSIWNLYCISRQLTARQPAETSIVFLRANLNLDCLILVQYNINILACLTFFDYRSSARAASFCLSSIRFSSRRFVGNELAECGVYYHRSSPYLCCTVKRTLGSFRDEIERDEER